MKPDNKDIIYEKREPSRWMFISNIKRKIRKKKKKKPKKAQQSSHQNQSNSISEPLKTDTKENMSENVEMLQRFNDLCSAAGLITQADFNGVIENELSKPSQNRSNSLFDYFTLHQLRTGDMESKLKTLEMHQKFNDFCLVAGLITKEEVMKQNKLLKPKNFLSKEFEICHLETDYITLPDESEKIGCWPCGYRKKIQVIRKYQRSKFQICLPHILKK